MKLFTQSCAPLASHRTWIRCISISQTCLSRPSPSKRQGEDHRNSRRRPRVHRRVELAHSAHLRPLRQVRLRHLRHRSPRPRLLRRSLSASRSPEIDWNPRSSSPLWPCSIRLRLVRDVLRLSAAGFGGAFKRDCTDLF
ncbi:unnamed protein product [Camellia sinensis]